MFACWTVFPRPSSRRRALNYSFHHDHPSSTSLRPLSNCLQRWVSYTGLVVDRLRSPSLDCVSSQHSFRHDDSVLTSSRYAVYWQWRSFQRMDCRLAYLDSSNWWCIGWTIPWRCITIRVGNHRYRNVHRSLRYWRSMVWPFPSKFLTITNHQKISKQKKQKIEI